MTIKLSIKGEIKTSHNSINCLTDLMYAIYIKYRKASIYSVLCKDAKYLEFSTTVGDHSILIKSTETS